MEYKPLAGGVPETLSNITSSIVASESGRWFGRATMERLSNGNWVLVYEESTAHSETHDDVVHIKFSNDQGATWTAEDTYLDAEAVTGFPAYPDDGIDDPYGPGDTYILEAPNGDLWLHTWKVYYSGTLMQGTWHKKSTDGGKTWGAFEQIIFGGQTETETNKTGMTEQHFILDGVIYMAGRVYDTPFSTVKMCLYKSEDNGATWSWISDMSAYSDKTHEAAMEYLGDNRILVFMRDSANARSTMTYSNDFGATWAPVVPVELVMNYIGRNRMYTVNHLAGLPNWWNDNRLVMVGFVLTNPGSSQGRRNAIWLSSDAGIHWSQPLYLDDAAADAGYGDILLDTNTNTYRVVTYIGGLGEANLKQYNFGVSW